MDLLIGIVLCLFFLTLIVTGEIYFALDKQRIRAFVCFQNMRVNLDKWVEVMVELAEGSDTGRKTAEELRALAQDYFNYKRYKETMMAVSLVNSIAAIAEQLEEKASGTESDRILTERADFAGRVEPLRNEYNNCVRRLNARLDSKLPATVGRLFRISKMEKLRQL